MAGQSDRPEGMQVQISRMTLTNSRSEPKCSFAELAKLLNRLDSAHLFVNGDFPADPEQLTPIPNVFRKHVDRTDSPYLDKTIEGALLGSTVPKENTLNSGVMIQTPDTLVTSQNMKVEALRMDATRDVWCVVIEQFWLEFIGVPSSKNRPVSFMESFPVTLWLAKPMVAKQQTHSHDKEVMHSESDYTRLQNGDCHNLNGKIIVPTGAEDIQNQSRKSKMLKNYYSLDGDVTEAANPVISTSFQTESPSSSDFVISNSAVISDSAGSIASNTDISKLADLHILVNVGSRVSLQINHYQYLFIMRLIQTITKYQAAIDEDTQCIIKDLGPEKKFAITLALDELELALICPPLRELPSLRPHSSDSTEDAEQDEIPLDAAAAVAVTVAPSDEELEDQLQQPVVDSSKFQHTDDVNESDLPLTTLVSKSHSYGKIISSSTSSPDDLLSPVDALVTEPPSRKEVCSESNLIEFSAGESSPKIHITEDGAVSTGSGSPINVPCQLPHRQQLHRDTSAAVALQNRKSKEIKKSFNTAMSSLSKFTGKVKQVAKRELLDIGDRDESNGLSEDWETLSMKSGSSDEDFMILKFQNESEMPAFVSSKPTATDASSTVDTNSDMPEEMESTSTSFATSSGLERPKGMVSISTASNLN